MSAELANITRGTSNHIALLLQDRPQEKKGSLVGGIASKLWGVTKFTANATNQLAIKPTRIALNAIGTASSEVLTSRPTGLEMLVAIPAVTLSQNALEHGKYCAIMNAAKQTFFSDTEDFITKFWTRQDWASFATPTYWKDLYEVLTNVSNRVKGDNFKEILVRYANTHSKEEIQDQIRKAIENTPNVKNALEKTPELYDSFVKHLEENYFKLGAEGINGEDLPENLQKHFKDATALEGLRDWFNGSILAKFTNAQCLRFEGYTEIATPFIYTLLALVALRIGAKVAYNVAGDVKEKYFPSEAEKVRKALDCIKTQVSEIKSQQAIPVINSFIPKSLTNAQYDLSPTKALPPSTQMNHKFQLALPSSRKMTKEEAKQLAAYMVQQEKIKTRG